MRFDPHDLIYRLSHTSFFRIFLFVIVVVGGGGVVIVAIVIMIVVVVIVERNETRNFDLVLPSCQN